MRDERTVTLATLGLVAFLMLAVPWDLAASYISEGMLQAVAWKHALDAARLRHEVDIEWLELKESVPANIGKAWEQPV